uniref:Uncharacterized protein n=1 Tax=Brassica campestris TaxID=3711 RepID=M4DTF6_BRACM
MVMNTELLPTSRVVSTGTIVNDDGKDKKSKFDFEPFRPALEMGAIETLIKALEMGTIETLIVWENLDINRCELKNNTIWRSSGEALWERLIKATSMTQSPTMS